MYNSRLGKYIIAIDTKLALTRMTPNLEIYHSTDTKLALTRMIPNLEIYFAIDTKLALTKMILNLEIYHVTDTKLACDNNAFSIKKEEIKNRITRGEPDGAVVS